MELFCSVSPVSLRNSGRTRNRSRVASFACGRSRAETGHDGGLLISCNQLAAFVVELPDRFEPTSRGDVASEDGTTFPSLRFRG
jgi:hypothetical protein